MTMQEACALFLAKAHSQIGVTEKRMPQRVLAYARAVLNKIRSVSTPWCSVFANWVVKECGFVGTKNAWARDWLKWGVALSEAVPGCIMVFERNGKGGDSHVTFWTGELARIDGAFHYLCVGGNQNDSVCEKWYSVHDLLGMRGPRL